MSPASDPAEISAPMDPAAYRRGMGGLGGWAMVAFGLICLIAGAALATLAPRILAARPVARSLAEAPVPAATPGVPASPAMAPAPVQLAAAPPSAELERLHARIAAL